MLMQLQNPNEVKNNFTKKALINQGFYIKC